MLQIYNSETLQNDCIMKKLTRLLLGAFCVLLFSFKGTAQNFTVTGQVISQTTNAPLQGVTVNVKGTSVSVMTDENGKYSISVPKPGSVLSISYVGMVTLEKTVQGTGSQDFILVPGNASMEEVVVIGYGQQKKSLLTGAISSVKASQLTTITNYRIEQALLGRVAGVSVGPQSPLSAAEFQYLNR